MAPPRRFRDKVGICLNCERVERDLALQLGSDYPTVFALGLSVALEVEIRSGTCRVKSEVLQDYFAARSAELIALQESVITQEAREDAISAQIVERDARKKRNEKLDNDEETTAPSYGDSAWDTADTVLGPLLSYDVGLRLHNGFEAAPDAERARPDYWFAQEAFALAREHDRDVDPLTDFRPDMIGAVFRAMVDSTVLHECAWNDIPEPDD